MTDTPSPLASLGPDLRTLVVGATGGIGRALVDELARDASVATVFAGARRPSPHSPDRTVRVEIDITDEATVSAAAAQVAADGALDLIIVATGALHDEHGLVPEKRWEDLDPDSLARAFAVNATGPAVVAKHFLPLLNRERRSVYAALSARVGSIADNRLGGWYGYRASKAALNMLLRTLAIELARRNPAAICIGLHPGTVDTPLSQPYRGADGRRRILTPTDAATRLLSVIGGLGADDTGRIIAWDGQPIPY